MHALEPPKQKKKERKEAGEFEFTFENKHKGRRRWKAEKQQSSRLYEGPRVVEQQQISRENQGISINV
jgi:hypothetical protein